MTRWCHPSMKTRWCHIQARCMPRHDSRPPRHPAPAGTAKNRSSRELACLPREMSGRGRTKAKVMCCVWRSSGLHGFRLKPRAKSTGLGPYTRRLLAWRIYVARSSLPATAFSSETGSACKSDLFIYMFTAPVRASSLLFAVCYHMNFESCCMHGIRYTRRGSRSGICI